MLYSSDYEHNLYTAHQRFLHSLQVSIRGFHPHNRSDTLQITLSSVQAALPHSKIRGLLPYLLQPGSYPVCIHQFVRSIPDYSLQTVHNADLLKTRSDIHQMLLESFLTLFRNIQLSISYFIAA